MKKRAVPEKGTGVGTKPAPLSITATSNGMTRTESEPLNLSTSQRRASQLRTLVAPGNGLNYPKKMTVKTNKVNLA